MGGPGGALGALEPQESYIACGVYNRVTQSLSKTLFSGGNRGNRAGFVELQAGVLTSLDPSPQGAADCHRGHRPSLLNLPAPRVPHQKATTVGRRGAPRLICGPDKLTLLLGLQTRP